MKTLYAEKSNFVEGNGLGFLKVFRLGIENQYLFHIDRNVVRGTVPLVLNV